MPLISILGTDRSPAAKAPPAQRAPLWRFLPIARRLQPMDVATVRRLQALVIEGTCLVPYLEPGDLVWVDRWREARPGDLVLVSMRYEPAGPPTMIGGNRPPPIERAALKQLQLGSDAQLRLCASDGCSFARAHRIEGVAVLVMRRPSITRWRSVRAPLGEMAFLPALSA